jgi:hypothetical protein
MSAVASIGIGLRFLGAGLYILALMLVGTRC